MYQEIIESEPEYAETVKQFAAKMGISLKRMEQLILSMLKITRLDTGNIIFCLLYTSSRGTVLSDPAGVPARGSYGGRSKPYRL